MRARRKLGHDPLLPVLCGLAVGACGQTQLLVFVDTNLAIPRFADTLLIERLARGDDGELHAVDKTTELVANRDRWPASFGVALQHPTLFRFRLYSGWRTQNGASAQPTPWVGTTIDRIVELAPSPGGVQRVQLFLDADCMGVAANLHTGESCVSASVLQGLPLTATTGSPMGTRVGTWDALSASDCVGTPRADSDGLHNDEVCIRGGVFAMGDSRLSETSCTPDCVGGPERMVRLSSFFIDRYEVTTKRWQRALNAGLRRQLNLGPIQASWNAQVCLNQSVRSDESQLPVNCVLWSEAAAFCAFDGGRMLISEAQWEFAATSRGRDQRYVWGDAINPQDPTQYDPDCSQANFLRDLYSTCRPIPERRPDGTIVLRVTNVGAYPVDQTEQGVFDMNGNLSEWARDDVSLLSAGCWDPALGVLRDPVCRREGFNLHAFRGPSWASKTPAVSTAIRGGLSDGAIRGDFDSNPTGFQGSFVGFRCTRPAQ